MYVYIYVCICQSSLYVRCVFLIARRFAVSHDTSRRHIRGMEFPKFEATSIQFLVGVAWRFESHSRHVRGLNKTYQVWTVKEQHDYLNYLNKKKTLSNLLFKMPFYMSFLFCTKIFRNNKCCAGCSTKNTRQCMTATRKRTRKRCTGGNYWMLGHRFWSILARRRSMCRKAPICSVSVDPAARSARVRSAQTAKDWASSVSFVTLRSEVCSLFFN